MNVYRMVFHLSWVITIFFILAAHNKAICTNNGDLHIQRDWPQVTAIVTVTGFSMVEFLTELFGYVTYWVWVQFLSLHCNL